MNINRYRIARLLGIAALLGAAAGLILILEGFSFQSYSLVWNAARNFGHVPLFGLMAVILLWLSRLALGKRIDIPAQYAISWLTAVGIGALSEYLQIATQRDADINDWLLDILGATTFLALHLTIDPWFSARGRRLQMRHKVLIRIVTVLAVAAAGMPIYISFAAQMHRRALFPTLYTFDNYFERSYLETAEADLNITDAPGGWTDCGSKVAEVTFFPAQYPTLYCTGPFPDWTGYDELWLDVFSPADASLELHITIKDQRDSPYQDRFNGRLQIQPGHNRLRIPLSEIEHAPAARTLDLSSVKVLCIFVVEPEYPVVLYFDDLRLLRDDRPNKE